MTASNPIHPMPHAIVRGEDSPNRWLAVLTPDAIGDLAPPGADGLSRALKAVKEKRFADADAHLRRYSSEDNCDVAWAGLLDGITHLVRMEPSSAEVAFRKSVEASRAALDADATDDPQRQLLHAAAAEQLGMLLRRLDRAAEALPLHTAAHDIRRRIGTTAERCESAISAAISARLVGDFEQAKRWHRAAIDHASTADVARTRLLAIAWTSFAVALGAIGDWADAITSFRRACSHWREHDPAAATAPVGDWHLAEALITYASNECERNPTLGRELLDEALPLGNRTYEALVAWDGACGVDTERCCGRLDFATRLRASLGD